MNIDGLIDLRHLYLEIGEPFPRRPLEDITALIVHHSAGSTPSTQQQALAQIDVIYNHHLKIGFPSVGYHFIVDPLGNIYWINSLNRTTYHTAWFNYMSIGVCVLGTYERIAPSDAAITSLNTLYKALNAHLGRKLNLYGHAERNPASTEYCPSKVWHQWKKLVLEGLNVSEIDELRAEIAHLNGVNTELKKQVEYKDELLVAANSELGAIRAHIIPPLEAAVKELEGKISRIRVIVS